MASAIESDELVRIGPGTVMGELMRQYWIPAAKSSEVKAGDTPMRLMLLGEKLIAFRDATTGRVGVMDHRCPHRCASLFFGRNENDGIRCIYHGWKFDVDGNCLEMPNVAPAQRFEDKVRAKAYKVNERGGLIWVYMGSRAEAPPMPMIEATLLHEAEISAQFVQRECNWMQALEGDIDTSHFGFLHIGSVTPEQVQPDNLMKYQVANRAPEYHVADTEWGTMYAAYRPTDDDRIYWRFAQFGFPFWAQVPQGNFIDRVSARAWVPMDDGHTMSVTLNWTKSSRSTPPLKDGKPIPGAKAELDYLPNDGLVWPLASESEPRQRLLHRPRGAAQRHHFLRHHPHPHAGPGRHREHGRNHRPCVRASCAERSDDRPHPPPPRACGARLARQGHGTAGGG